MLRALKTAAGCVGVEDLEVEIGQRDRDRHGAIDLHWQNADMARPNADQEPASWLNPRPHKRKVVLREADNGQVRGVCWARPRERIVAERHRLPLATTLRAVV